MEFLFIIDFIDYGIKNNNRISERYNKNNILDKIINLVFLYKIKVLKKVKNKLYIWKDNK